MATITTEVRDILISIYVGMFEGAPGLNDLNSMVADYESGMTQKQIAAKLALSADFVTVYPTASLNSEVADQLVSFLLSDLTDAVAVAWSTNWVLTKLNAGISRAEVVVMSVNALKAATNPDFAEATALLNNRIEVAKYYSLTKELTSTNLVEKQGIIQDITNVADTVTAAKAVVDGKADGAVAQTFSLTTGIDSTTGTTGNDTINAVLGATADATLTALDVINGAAGTDTLNINALTAVTALPGATISNVETINVRAAAAVGTVGVNDIVNGGAADDAIPSAAIDFSSISGLNTLNVTQATAASIKAAATTDVAVSGVTGGIEVNGGKTVTVTDATNDNNITVGSIVAAAADDTNSAGTAAAGAVTVTDSKQGAGVIQIDGGTTVTVTATSTTDSGAIAVGATKAASGAVSVTSNLNGDGVATLDQGDITVKGGSTVTVNSNLTIAAKDQAASNAHTFGDVLVNSDGKTTSVTVNQTYAETEFTKAAVAVVKELHTVTFKALASGETTIVDGLTFTAGKALTAAEVAQAFSNLTASDTQANGGKVANGVFTGNLSANFTSGAASGAVVVFTAKDEAETLALTAGAVDPTETVVAGTVASGAATSTNSVTYGAVRVDGNATASITTVNVNGYGSADLGNTGTDLNALTTLSLANSGGVANVATSATTLGLTVNKVASAVNLDMTAATIKTLNVTATGANSTFGLTAAAVETLTVAGDKVLDIDTGSTLTVLKTVTVSGSAGLSIVADGANVTSVNTTATTGTVTATIDASKATYTGGAGVDNVTVTAATPSKAISLGAGNDSLDLTGATSLAGAFTASGGDGTDTLVMSAVQAAATSLGIIFKDKIDGFERLTIGDAAAQQVVNLANLDDINYVKLGKSAASAAQSGTITFAGLENDTAPETLVTTITDAGGTSTFITTVAASTAATGAVVSAVTTNVTGTSSQTYTLSVTTGVVTITAGTAGIPFTATTAPSSGDDITAGAYAAGTASTFDGITLNNLASGGTVVLTDTGSVIVNIKDATTGLTDVLNVLTTSNGNTTYGQLTANKVETINITVDDIDNDTGGDAEALTLAADSVTKITVANSGDIVVVNGVSQPDITKLNLTVTGATALATVDASAMLGVFTYTASNGTTTVTGGAGKDVLTGSGSSDVLIGGAGNDTLTGANLTTLTGGAGNDIFMMNKPTNVNSYSSITDLAAGDVIDLDSGNAGTVVFTKSAVVLAGTAVFQDYANAAANALGTDANDAGWFQYGGNTYIVQSGNNTVNDFVNGVDAIIQIVGLVNLSTASYNQSIGTLEIA